MLATDSLDDSFEALLEKDENPRRLRRSTVLIGGSLLVVASLMFASKDVVGKRFDVAPSLPASARTAQFLESSAALCSSHPKCADLGLYGDCCPMTDGIVLQCCDQQHIARSHNEQRRAAAKIGGPVHTSKIQNESRIINHRVISNSQFAKDESKLLGDKAAAGLRFQVYSEDFYSLFVHRRLPEISSPFVMKDFEFAHEGPVYLKETNEVFVVSNRLKGHTTLKAEDWTDLTNQSVRLHAVNLDTKAMREIKSDVLMANGATINCSSRDVIILSQGVGNWMDPSSYTPSAIHRLNPHTGESSVILNNVYGLPFNSLNDVVMTREGTLWFTDPVYGHQQGFLGGKPALPNAIWALSPADAGPRIIQMRTVSRPNGLAVAADGSRIFCTDTGYALGDEESRTVYEHVIENEASGTPTFRAATPIYYAEDGIPDGIKTDDRGNIYLGQGDGVTIITPRGLVLGKILMPPGHGATQIVFGGPGFDHLIILAEKSLWVVPMAVRAAVSLRC